MRHQTTPLYYELTTDGGAKAATIVPGSAAQSATFVINGIRPRVDNMRNYLTRLWVNLTTVFDPDGAGNAVSWDKLAKGMVNCEVISPIIGTVYPAFHTQGPTLMHLISFLGLGYLYPQGARTQIPADTDTDVDLELIYVVPFAQEFLVDPMETTQWAGFFDGGTVEPTLATASVFDGDYAGSVIKATTQFRVLAETAPSPREFIGVPFQWRRRQIAGGGDAPVLKNVGGATALNGIAQGCGLAALCWLTNATGIGLGGPDGVDNITSISMDWRGQKVIQNLDGFFYWARTVQERRGSPISEGADAALLDTTQWPKAMGATGVGRPAADAEQMFLPIVLPGRMAHTSKFQRVLGDLQIDFTTTTPITNAHEFMSLEFLEFTDAQLGEMAALGAFVGEPSRNNATGKPGALSDFRYTAVEFE